MNKKELRKNLSAHVLAQNSLREVEAACAGMIHIMPSANGHTRRYKVGNLVIEFELINNKLTGLMRFEYGQQLSDNLRKLAWHRAAEDFMVMNGMEPIAEESANTRTAPQPEVHERVGAGV